MQAMVAERRLLITGASAGLGRALALVAAGPGVVLHLSGRAAGWSGAVAEACWTKGATAWPRVVDVRDAAAMADWIGGAGRLDLVIANAGISAGTGGAVEPAATARAVFETNVTGVLN